MTEFATYLYAIIPAAPASALVGLEGVAGSPVRALGVGELACLVSSVDLAEFGENALRANLEDFAWLERTAREHDSVVQAAARTTTTLPLRLATICASDTSARARLRRLHDPAATALAQLDGREEWGLKLFASPSPAVEAVAASGAPSGKAYLERRRQELTRREDASVLAALDADAVYTRLSELAAAAHRHRPQDQRLTGAAQPMVLNAAFLIDRDRVPEFQAAVDELAAARGPESVTLTGPWPAYSFAAVEEEA